MGLIDEVRDRLDILEVVSRYVDLDTRTRTPKARCPFHVERTPSFVVFPETRRWRCFGACATGGDALAFLMRQENISFGDALKREAGRLGIERPEKRREDTQAPLFEANEVAARYFRSVLEGPRGQEARSYLEGRGISMAAARRRGLGLSPSGIETLAGHLRASGVPGAAARDAGLINRARDGAWRDMFHGRLTVEIRDTRGRLRGFGARSLDGSEPKYLNTARTRLFDKSGLLYGLNWAADTVRAQRQAVVVEGYMDVITAHEHGFKDVVASMGTAITPEQLSLLLEVFEGSDPDGSRAVVLALDADAAGQEATSRALERAWLAGAAVRAGARGQPALALRVARLTGGKDPDDLIRRSPEAWREAIAAAAAMIDFMIERAQTRFQIDGDSGKMDAAKALLPMISAIDNQYEQERAFTRLEELIGVTRDRFLPLTRPKRAASSAETAPIWAQNLGDTPGEALERHLLALVLRFPQLREYATAVPEEHFLQSGYRTIFTAWSSATTLESLMELVDEPLAELVSELQLTALPPADQATMVADIIHCVRRLHERHLRHLKAEEERVFADVGAPETGGPTELEMRSLETNAGLKEVFAQSGAPTPRMVS